MDTRLADELIRTRRALKKKYQSLRADMVQAEMEIEKHMKPVSQPLKELVAAVTAEQRESHQTFDAEIPASSSTPIRQQSVHFLKSDTLAESEGEPSTEKERSISPKTLWRRHQKSKEVRKEMNQMMRTMILDDYLESIKNTEVRDYVKAMIFDSRGTYDIKGGVNLDLDKNIFTMGNKIVDFRGDNFVILDRNREVGKYKVTTGLLELLFKKNPNMSWVSKSDHDMYQSVLRHTSAHKRYYDPGEQIEGNRGEKYKKAIQPNVSYKVKRKRGKGLLTVNSKKVEFIPWKNPNTLVDRLQILVASQMAGHTGHDNEITNIIYALRRAKIIK